MADNVIFGDDDDTPKSEEENMEEDQDVNESVEKTAEAMAKDAPETETQQDLDETVNDENPEEPEDEQKLDEFFEEMSKDKATQYIGHALKHEKFGGFKSKEVFLEACFNAEKMSQDREHVKKFIRKRSDKMDSKTDATQRPAYSNNDGNAAWINTDKNGNEYLAVKVDEGEYVNIFPQTDIQRLALKNQHEVNKAK